MLSAEPRSLSHVQLLVLPLMHGSHLTLLTKGMKLLIYRHSP